jgi:hypothetical protein
VHETFVITLAMAEAFAGDGDIGEFGDRPATSCCYL